MERGFSLEEWLDQRVSVLLVQEGGSGGATPLQYAAWPAIGQLEGISEWGIMVTAESAAEGQPPRTMRFFPWGAIRSIQQAPEDREQSS